MGISPITGDRSAVALEAPPAPPDQWMGTDQGEVVPPQPRRPKPPKPGPTLICDMVNHGDAIHYEFTSERAPWPAHDPVVRGCRWLNQQTNRLGGWLLDQAGRLVNRLADHLQAPPIDCAPYCPEPTPSPTPPKLVDDTGHAREQARDPQCSQGRQPAVGRCTADGTYVPPTPTTRVSTPTPTPPPPAPAPTPEPTPTPAPTPGSGSASRYLACNALYFHILQVVGGSPSEALAALAACQHRNW